MKNKILYIPGTVRGTDFQDDQREFDFIISSEKRDTYGTIFTSDGWDFSRYAENPLVFFQHRSHSNDPDDLIGVTVKGPWKDQLEDGTPIILARVRFEDAETNPKAEKIRKKIIAGTIRMASVGANVTQYRWGDKEVGEDPETVYFTRQELFEWSVVNLGSNPDASVKRMDETMMEIRKEIQPDPKKEVSKNGISAMVARLEIVKYKSK